jgi:uncharacterized protein YndB with AHSA1/START domain
VIKASAKDVYRAFTNQVAVENWLCNNALVDAVQKTKLYFWWDNGYYTCGEFLKTIPNKEIIFSWRGRNDPGKTRVRVTLKQSGPDTVLTLEHRGIKPTPKWQNAQQEIKQGWETALENLVSILETGKDLRYINKPLLGINLQDYSPEIAAKLGVPLNEGVRLEGVMDGFGAKESGLQKDDVLVELNGKPITGYHGLTGILAKEKPGEIIEVGYYRGKEKKTTSVKLSPRPVPNVVFSLPEMVQIVESMYAEGDQFLADTVGSVTESEAVFKPHPTEWNIREVVAHLIHNEQDWHLAIHKLLADEPFFYPPNVQARIEATVAVYPTIPELMNVFKMAEAETLALLRRLPDEFVSQKDKYWFLFYNQLQFNGHLKEHLMQINDILTAIRGH